MIPSCKQKLPGFFPGWRVTAYVKFMKRSRLSHRGGRQGINRFAQWSPSWWFMIERLASGSIQTSEEFYGGSLLDVSMTLPYNYIVVVPPAFR